MKRPFSDCPATVAFPELIHSRIVGHPDKAQGCRDGREPRSANGRVPRYSG